MDPAQAIVFLAIVVLTIVFVVLGIQAFRVLKELRLTLSKTNRILDTAENITQNISSPINTFSSIITGITGVKTGSIIAAFLKKLSSKDQTLGRQEKEQDGK